MKIVVRHYVDGVGYVSCGQPVGTKKTETGNVPVLWPNRFDENNQKVVACEFCQERKEFKAAHGGDKMSKEDQKIMGKLHKRKVELVAEGEAEVRDANGKVVKELHPCAIVFDAIDLFFPGQVRQYKQLDSKFAKKKTLLDNWFTMGTDGMIDFDDPVSKEDRKREINVDLSFIDQQTKPYEEGLKVYQAKGKAKAEAQPLEDLDDDLGDDDDPPFDVDKEEKPAF